MCKDCGALLTPENTYKSKKTVCKLCYRHKVKQRSRKRKQQIVDFYGGECACCGEWRLEFLTIDHGFNNGSEHRKRIAKEDNRSDRYTGEVFYRWIIRNNFPTNEGLRVLCWNCNCCIGSYGYCIHKEKDIIEEMDYSVFANDVECNSDTSASTERRSSVS